MEWRDVVEELTGYFGQDGLKCCADSAMLAHTKQVREQVRQAIDADFAAGRSVWQVRAHSYRIIGENSHGHVFLNSPYYCEFGINGGWGYEKQSPGRVLMETVPARKSQFEPIDSTMYDALNREKFFLCCGPYYDAIHHSPPVSNVLRCGFRGWYERTQEALKATDDPEKWAFLEAALAGLEAIHQVQLRFAEQAEELLPQAQDDKQRKWLAMIAEHARRAPWEPPATFYEGLNCLWFCREVFALVDGLAANNLGWPDNMLNDLYQADLKAGRITPAEAQELVDLFILMGDARNNQDLLCDGPIVHEIEVSMTLGGCDKNGDPVYNDVTRMFLRSYREKHFIFPKPHCRYGKNSPDEYLLEVTGHIAQGTAIYSLVNDEGIIPALVKNGHTLEDAREYNCAGCWDIVVESREDNGNGNYLYTNRILNACFHDWEAVSKATGMLFFPMDTAQTFEQAYTILLDDIRQVLRYICAIQGINGAATWPKTWPTPCYSACMTGCLERGKDYSQGGCRYNPRAISFLFFANVVDSLLAIQHACFLQKICTLPELLAAVRADWENAEELRQKILVLPHWGDNSPEANAMGKRVFADLTSAIAPLRNERGGRFSPAIWSYREFFFLGKKTKATPDGRHSGDRLAQSLNPSHFRNTEAPSTVLNALSCLDFTDLAGDTVVNLVMDKRTFTPAVQLGLLRAASELKLQLLQINCADPAELREAQKHPENYPYLIVRLCGFSVRFTSLSPELQEEVIQRRSY